MRQCGSCPIGRADSAERCAPRARTRLIAVYGTSNGPVGPVPVIIELGKVNATASIGDNRCWNTSRRAYPLFLKFPKIVLAIHCPVSDIALLPRGSRLFSKDCQSRFCPPPADGAAHAET